MNRRGFFGWAIGSLAVLLGVKASASPAPAPSEEWFDLLYPDFKQFGCRHWSRSIMFTVDGSGKGKIIGTISCQVSNGPKNVDWPKLYNRLISSRIVTPGMLGLPGDGLRYRLKTRAGCFDGYTLSGHWTADFTEL